ncbi:MAG TPA: uroporphyrinogen-III C-methyltransferase [Acidimicrobiales bacterium]|nr:uroporphyrinogen-III C-methyltransferase [Acidimicrobiales bacterium]
MTVYLVGAGPGDPGLLTRRAERLLQAADVVVHDRLVDPAVLALARPGAELVDVGKPVGGGAPDQGAINDLLVRRGARETVVRLKGGDPYVFGRGGEEALALEAAGVDYEVVPGVPSIAAVPAAAGVPLTMRGVSSTIAVVTGHDPGALASWPPPSSQATLVVLMGAARRAEVAEHLLAAGWPEDTPVLAVTAGTTPEQTSLRTTLAGLGGAPVESPATIVVGRVAGLHLASIEARPLFGWSVVVTRPARQAGRLLEQLAEAGARPIAFPTIEVAPPSDPGALEAAARRAGSFEWVVFASANAVEALFAHLRDARDLGAARVAAVGPATARALAERGVRADLVATRAVAEGLVEAFPPAPEGRRPPVLVPRAAAARDALVEGLAALGYEVEAVEAYRSVPPAAAEEALRALEGAHAVVFSSPSTVRGFLALAGRELLPPVAVSIGPETTRAAKAAGVAVECEATRHDAEGIVAALASYARGRPRPVGAGPGAGAPGPR